jgi:pSer/pThr/pTyr-binding forkhead associated (FHA) protein
MATLRITTGPAQGQSIECNREVVIGREGDLVVEDDEASRRHTAIRPGAGGIEVEDLGSLNGTFIDGQRISEVTTLTSSAKLRIGQTHLELEVTQSDLPVAQPQRTVLSDSPLIDVGERTVMRDTPVVDVERTAVRDTPPAPPEPRPQAPPTPPPAPEPAPAAAAEPPAQDAPIATPEATTVRPTVPAPPPPGPPPGAATPPPPGPPVAPVPPGAPLPPPSVRATGGGRRGGPGHGPPSRIRLVIPIVLIAIIVVVVLLLTHVI